MPETKNPNTLSIDQVQAILNNDHIRQHLVQSGYIDQRGNIIRKNENNDHSRRLHTSNSRRSYPTFSPSHQRPMGNITNSNGQGGTRLADDRRLKSASTAQSKETNKSYTTTPFASLNQSTYVHNVLLRRAVSPKILPPGDRCLVTLQYYGPDLNIEYDRDWFEPNGDEILIMQQHCGGENFVVFKGFLKPDEILSFQSRRHTDYPFALAFYVNGIIKNRLSICCESRCNNYMRIGGKNCLFAIIKVEKARTCRRCRFAERMKKLIEAEPKPPTPADQSHRQKSNKTSESSSKSPTTDTKNSGSTSAQKTNPKTTAAHSSTPEKNGSDKSSSELTVPHPVKSKPTAARKLSSESIGTDITSPKPTVSPTKSSKTAAVRSSSPQQVESSTSNPEPTVSRTKSAKTNGVRLSSPQPVESDISSSEPTVSRTKSAKTNGVRLASPQQVESDISSLEPTVPRTTNSNAPVVRTSGSEERHESPPPIKIRSTTVSNHQPQATNPPNSYLPDFEEPKKKIRSSKSTSRKNKPPEISSSDSSENRTRIPHRVLTVPRKHDSDDEVATDESNPDFERFLAGAHRRKQTDD